MRRKIAITLVAAALVAIVAPGISHAQKIRLWIPVSGCASWITQDKAGQVYAAGCGWFGDKTMYKRTGDTWTPLSPEIHGVQISAYDWSSIWVRKANGTMYYRNTFWPNNWIGPVAFGGGAACSSYLAAGPNNVVWSLGCEPDPDKSIWRRNADGSWTAIPGRAKQIGVLSDGTAWVVSSPGHQYYWNGRGWTGIPGKTNQLTTGASASYAAKGISDGKLYRWDKFLWKWELYIEPFFPLKLFTGTGDNYWAVSTTGDIYYMMDVPLP